MNKDNAAQFLPLVQALADGKTLQWRQGVDSAWHDTGGEVRFNYDATNYRIKPEVFTREFWVSKDRLQFFRVRPEESDKTWEEKGWTRVTMTGTIGG